MGTVMVSLLPLIVGAAVLPVWIIMALFLLLQREFISGLTAGAVKG